MVTQDRPVRQTLTEGLEAALRHDILSGSLQPGTRLRVADLAERYRVSPTPVREGLQRLAEQGLVDLHPQIGARVATLSVDDIRDVYSARSLLELEALRRAIRLGDATWVTDVVREWERFRRLEESMTREGAIDQVRAFEGVTAHRDLHLTILRACDSAWLMRFLETLYAHSVRYQFLLRSTPQAVRVSMQEHEEIVTAVLRRDTETAVRVIGEQLEIATEQLAELALGREASMDHI
jgi:DNA-binding GntR family transcriptional regulator